MKNNKTHSNSEIKGKINSLALRAFSLIEEKENLKGRVRDIEAEVDIIVKQLKKIEETYYE